MKRLVLLLVCFLKLQAEESYPQKILMHAPATVETRLTSWSETDDMGKPYSTLLGKKDVNNSTSSNNAMRTLSTPGRYYLTESIQISPINTNVTCFKITSSNVTLDLRGHSITGTTTQGSGMIALEVGSSLSNVVICNGTFNAINGYGIKVGFSCDNIIIKDMVINNCTNNGIDFSGSDSFIERVKIFNCTGASGLGGAIGLYLSSANRLKIIDSKFDYNQASNDNAFGVYMSFSNTIECVGCTANQNAGGIGVSDYNVYGFYTSMCNNLIFKDCETSGGTTATGTAYGFSLNYSNNAVLENCVANRNIALGAQAYGFRLESSQGVFLKNCHAVNNSSNEHAYGFMAYQSNYNTFENCQAIGQSSSSFSISTTVAGFCSLGSRGNIFKDCVASGNATSGLSGSQGIGFYFSEAEKYSHIYSCIAHSNDGSLGTAYGIFFDGAKWCTVKNSQIYANTGTVNGYGIRDSSNSSMSMFVQNFAYGNGSSDGTIVNNYDVKPSPNDTANAFPVKIGYLSSFAGFDTANAYHNLELVEQTA